MKREPMAAWLEWEVWSVKYETNVFLCLANQKWHKIKAKTVATYLKQKRFTHWLYYGFFQQ